MKVGVLNKELGAMMAAIIRHARARYAAAARRSENLSRNVPMFKHYVKEKTCRIKIDSSDSKVNFCTPPSPPKNVPKVDDSVKTWHFRLGRAVSLDVIKRHVKDDLLPHVNCKTTNYDCCLKGKGRRRFMGSLTSADRIGIPYVDTKGKLEAPSIHRNSYFVTIVEEYGRLATLRPLRSKADAASEFLRFIRYFEMESSHTVSKAHTEGGTEFRRTVDELDEAGVQISVSSLHSLE